MEIKVTPSTASPIGKYLASVNGVESLAIVDSSFEEAQTVQAIALSNLKRETPLNAVALNRCEIASEAFAEFAPLVSEAKMLDLAYCALNKRLDHVAPLLGGCARLTSLSLQVNDLGDDLS